jgi:hypothetical protein
VFAKVAKVKGRRSKDVWLALALVSAFACQKPTQKQREPEVVWRRLGSWSGTGNTQTESFLFESGALRVRWETLNERTGHVGKFRLILQSAVSGRQLAVAADQRGVGKGESYVSEPPHQAYVLIESSDVDWSFTVDEAVIGTTPGPS